MKKLLPIKQIGTRKKKNIIRNLRQWCRHERHNPLPQLSPRKSSRSFHRENRLRFAGR
jgi:hypothetical protein